MVKFRYSTFAQQVIFGDQSLDQLDQAIDPFGWRRLLLCTSGSSQRNGQVARIQGILGERLVAVYDRVQPHVPDSQVTEALTLAKEHAVDAIIGLGGGSPIGMAKAASFAFEDPRGDQPPLATLPTAQPRVPVIAIPTTYAGSEMTPVYGVTHHSDGTARKVTVGDPRITPKLVIYDPQLTLDLPSELTASTGINALAHCVEAVYSVTRNPLSTAAALEGTRYIAHALPRCYEAGNDLEARTEMQIGSYLAGVALANVAMGLHHGLCHVLGGTAGVPHGIANAIILPYAMEYNADACAPELAQVAQAMGIARDGRDDAALARQAALRVRAWTSRMNLPQHLRDAGVKESDLAHLAELAAQSRTIKNNPKPVTVADLAALLRQAW